MDNLILLLPLFAGLLFGVLINYLADVLPHTLRLSRPVCNHEGCGHPYSNSEYLLHKKCPVCGKRRSTRTFTLLAIMVAMSVFVWLFPPKGLGYWFGMLLLAYLVTVALIDFEHRYVLLPLSISGIILAAIAGLLRVGWLSTLVGGLTGFLVLYLFYWGGVLFSKYRAKKLGLQQDDGEEALGSGDVTLALIMGLMLGFPLVITAIFGGILLAGILSLVIVVWLLITHQYEEKIMNFFIPLGPSFILMAIFLIYFPNWIVK